MIIIMKQLLDKDNEIVEEIKQLRKEQKEIWKIRNFEGRKKILRKTLETFRVRFEQLDRIQEGRI